MLKCEACGNHYDQPLRITYGGSEHFFDCFECAIHALAPHCASCGLRVIGHGLESQGAIFCSGHCARVIGQGGMIDHTPIGIALNPHL